MRDRFFGRLDLGRHRRIAHDLLVDDAFDAQELVAGHGGHVHEVEAQTIGCHQRPRLLDVRAEDLSQCRMKQVSSRMIAARRIAGLVGDFRGDNLTAAECARLDAHEVQPRPRLTWPDDALDGGNGSVGTENASAVRHLTAGLEIERRARERDVALRPGGERID